MMIYLIDDRTQIENYFWNCVHVIATEKQKQRLLDGYPVLLGGTKFQIIFEDEEETSDK